MSKPAEDLIQRHRFTVADFHRLGERSVFRDNARVELVEGEIIDMTPIGSRQAAAVRRLDQILARAVGDWGIVSVQNPVVLGEYSEPEPEIALLRPRYDFYASAHPGPTDVFLLIEVGDISARYDHEVKIPLYARHGIPEVWLVDLEGASPFGKPAIWEAALTAFVLVGCIYSRQVLMPMINRARDAELAGEMGADRRFKRLH